MKVQLLCFHFCVPRISAVSWLLACSIKGSFKKKTFGTGQICNVSPPARAKDVISVDSVAATMHFVT